MPLQGQPVKELRLANLSTSLQARPVLCPKGAVHTTGTAGSYDYFEFYLLTELAEQLKEDNQMEWVGRMNNIRQRATEIINAEFIYA